MFIVYFALLPFRCKEFATIAAISSGTVDHTSESPRTSSYSARTPRLSLLASVYSATRRTSACAGKSSHRTREREVPSWRAEDGISITSMLGTINNLLRMYTLFSIYPCQVHAHWSSLARARSLCDCARRQTRVTAHASPPQLVLTLQ